MPTRAALPPPTEHHPADCAAALRLRLLVRAGTADPSAGLLHRIAVEIHRCCGHSLLKAHRLAWGLSVREVVASLNASEHRGLDHRAWRRWELGGRPDADYRDALCRFFHTNQVGLGMATDYTDPADVPDLPDLPDLPAVSGTATGTPATTAGPAPAAHRSDSHQDTSGPPTARTRGADRSAIERQLTMTAHESAEFHDRLSAHNPGTLDLLRDQARRVARSFANQPRLEVFASARALRDRAFALLTDGGHLADSTDLYFLTGAACGMLADITEDFGLRAEAMAHARTAWLCAERSGHHGLMAWVLGEQSLIAYYDGRPAQAVRYAQAGQRFAGTESVSVYLPAAEARAAGALGDAETARAALGRAADARDRVSPGDLDGLGGILGYPVGKQRFYAAQTYLALSDGPAVIPEAEACVAAYRSGPAEERALDNEVNAQVNLATAQVLAGDLDAARAAAQPALTLRPDLRTAAVQVHLRGLHRRLSAAAVAAAPVATDLRDQIEDALTAPPPPPIP